MISKLSINIGMTSIRVGMISLIRHGSAPLKNTRIPGHDARDGKKS